MNGAADRLFLSGNAQYRNYDWYSGMNDPTYWADTAYAVLGTQQSAIVGYSIVNERLATHKDNMEAGRNVIIREGNLMENRPAFPIVNTLQGEGAIAPRSFAYLVNEPLFLTKLGVFAITAQDVTGEKIRPAAQLLFERQAAGGAGHGRRRGRGVQGHVLAVPEWRGVYSGRAAVFLYQKRAVLHPAVRGLFYRTNMPRACCW